MTSDLDLLEKFARQNSQDAFGEIVRRHLDLVYSAALRQVRSPQLAEEIAQSVFADLACSAGELSGTGVAPVGSLTQWLYAVTRRTAIDVIRKESRRQLREQIAVEMSNMNANERSAGVSPAWSEIEKFLDEAMESLDETDRSAVLLRYFENKSLREVGETLGTSDDAAQKRVSRAVERLREFFSKHSISIGASGLAVLISANAVQSAPVGLAVTISAAALAGTAMSTSTAIAATKVIAMTTLQKSVIGAAFLAAIGAGIFEAHQAAQWREQNLALQRQQAMLAEQNQQFQRELNAATNQLAALLAENGRLRSNKDETELLRLRGEVTLMDNNKNDATGIAAKAWLERVNQLKQWSEQNPAATIPEFQFLTQQDWLNAARSDLKTDNDYRRAMSSLRNDAENKFAGKLQRALSKYLQANNKQFPTDLNQLQSYFASPVDEAILQRWEIVPAKNIPNVGVGEPNIVTEKAAVDDLLDGRLVIGVDGYGSTEFLSSEIGEVMQPVYQAYRQAHGENWAGFDVSNLLDFAKTPEQQAAVQKLIAQQQLRSTP